MRATPAAEPIESKLPPPPAVSVIRRLSENALLPKLFGIVKK